MIVCPVGWTEPDLGCQRKTEQWDDDKTHACIVEVAILQELSKNHES